NRQNNINTIKPLTFGEKIFLMTKVLYEKQRRESQALELDPDNFQAMLEDSEPLLIGFFSKLYNAIIPDR
ncbi:17968_t:CDS:1, partial [Dentiscutata erythropus]